MWRRGSGLLHLWKKARKKTTCGEQHFNRQPVEKSTLKHNLITTYSRNKMDQTENQKDSKSVSQSQHCHNTTVQAPTRQEVVDLASELSLKLTEEQSEAFQRVMAHFSQALGRLEHSAKTAKGLPSEDLRGRSTRTPGRKPKQDENRHNAWVHRCEIRGAANGKLVGKTVAIKDNIAVAGMPMTNGSQLMDTFVPQIDSTVVTRLLDAGATILGKSACEDLCFSGGSHTGANGPVLNPHDTNRTSGGSSSGSAVLVSTHEVDIALGTDQAGSIRIPAAFCGLVGLKPTFGLIPYTGICSLEHNVDHVGPITKTVEDCALVLEALAGPDPMDSRTAHGRIAKFPIELTGQVCGKRVALLKEGFSLPMMVSHSDLSADCDAVGQIVREAVGRLSQEGVIVEEVTLPEHTVGPDIWFGLVLGGGAYSGLRSCTANPGFHHAALSSHLHTALQTCPHTLAPTVKIMMLFGEFLRIHYGSKFYDMAHNLVPWLVSKYDEVFDVYDAIVMPTVSGIAPKLLPEGASVEESLTTVRSLANNLCQANVTGHPALTVPAGFHQGMPVGAMFVGQKFDEESLLNLAFAFEKRSAVPVSQDSR